MYYIYQRVSTEKQSLQRQEGSIEEYCKANRIEVPKENIYSDIITGKTIKREHYQEMKSRLCKDDVLIMLDLDRLGRNWDLIKKEWKDLTDKGVYIVIVDCPLINVLPNPNGEISIDKRLIQEMMFTLLCYVSQKEVEKISLRTKESLRVKMQDPDFKIGHPRVHSEEKRAKVLEMRATGYSLRYISSQCDLPLSTVAQIVKGEQK